jgi:hypothetical protein
MDRPTTGAEATRLFVPPTNVLDTHNAVAGIVRLYASLLDEQAREIGALRSRLVDLERKLAIAHASIQRGNGEETKT